MERSTATLDRVLVWKHTHGASVETTRVSICCSSKCSYAHMHASILIVDNTMHLAHKYIRTLQDSTVLYCTYLLFYIVWRLCNHREVKHYAGVSYR